MKTVYSTTRPGFYDTKAIAESKWLQIVRGEAVVGPSERTVFSSNCLKWHDGATTVLQKILAQRMSLSTNPRTVEADAYTVTALDGSYVDVFWSAPGVSYEAATSSFDIYRDGVLLDSVASTETTYRDSTVEPGHGYEYSVVFNFYDVTCNTAPTPPPEPEEPDLLSGLTAYWKLEEPDNATRQDAHSGNYDLTARVYSLSGAGIIGDGSKFDAFSDNELTSSNSVFAATGPLTISAWVKFDSVLFDMEIVNRFTGDLGGASPPAAGYRLFFAAGSGIGFGTGNATDADILIASQSIVAGNRYHILAGFDGSNYFLRINAGTRIETSGFTPSAAATDFRIGCASDGSNRFFGIVDEVAIYIGRVLNDVEGTWLYNNGNGQRPQGL